MHQVTGGVVGAGQRSEVIRFSALIGHGLDALEVLANIGSGSVEGHRLEEWGFSSAFELAMHSSDPGMILPVIRFVDPVSSGGRLTMGLPHRFVEEQPWFFDPLSYQVGPR